jgi:septal ring factor EnvC (AmiA/AmiB activator)
VLFANRFQSYGLLVILDCGGGYDFVLSGMDRLDVSAGQRLARGQPVGQMGGYHGARATRPGDLYVELRRGGVPVDPDLWLVAGGSG